MLEKYREAFAYGRGLEQRDKAIERARIIWGDCPKNVSGRARKAFSPSQLRRVTCENLGSIYTMRERGAFRFYIQFKGMDPKTGMDLRNFDVKFKSTNLYTERKFALEEARNFAIDVLRHAIANEASPAFDERSGMFVIKVDGHPVEVTPEEFDRFQKTFDVLGGMKDERILELAQSEMLKDNLTMEDVRGVAMMLLGAGYNAFEYEPSAPEVKVDEAEEEMSAPC